MYKSMISVARLALCKGVLSCKTRKRSGMNLYKEKRVLCGEAGLDGAASREAHRYCRVPRAQHWREGDWWRAEGGGCSSSPSVGTAPAESRLAKVYGRSNTQTDLGRILNFT